MLIKFEGFILSSKFKKGDAFYQTNKIELKVQRIIGNGSLDATIIGEILDDKAENAFNNFKEGDKVILRLEKI